MNLCPLKVVAALRYCLTENSRLRGGGVGVGGVSVRIQEGLRADISLMA